MAGRAQGFAQDGLGHVLQAGSATKHDGVFRQSIHEISPPPVVFGVQYAGSEEVWAGDEMRMCLVGRLAHRLSCFHGVVAPASPIVLAQTSLQRLPLHR
jgi:hypothetical protein